MAISLRLKEIRKTAKLTQNDIANVLGTTREAYGMYESGKRQISLKVLDDLAQYYNVSIDYLVGRVDSEKEEMELLEAYRKLDSRGKQTILSLAKIEMQLSKE
ncbi:MAG TPA: helix-turn-helix transcriptional regulator [Candidatus Butyricicoccus avistercoris]|uniref:Helix-turn-helix transcriptional regulator n=1 Tax=Candidatus Butyricicoccus avistercoris TaxID=2838518 RepID=A0A9D1TIH9_9FIRM|nr:helix-turn-helix transcriptional regulator [Candidatus Butyricicoccus avistercoris]